MKLVCKELKGNEMVLDVTENATVEDVKKQIFQQANIPGNSLKFQF
jgi:hypothetical protein